MIGAENPLVDQLGIDGVRELNAAYEAGWNRYLAAIRRGGLRRSPLDDPNREVNLARLREAMREVDGDG